VGNEALVHLKNVQIVNGGQTSHALFEAYQENSKKLADVKVLVRIYESSDPIIASEIAETTNSQTPIRSRDLHANDYNQKKLEEAFEIAGYFYERKARQYQDKPRAKRIDAFKAGQACLAYYLEEPETAKKDRGRVFGDLYDRVFCDEMSSDKILACLQVLASIEKEKTAIRQAIRKEQPFDAQNSYLIDGAYHVLFTVGKLCDKVDVQRNDSAKATKLTPLAIEIVGSVVKKEARDDPGFSLNRFFKERRTKLIIADYIANKKMRMRFK
jgi:hypothetical protein